MSKKYDKDPLGSRIKNNYEDVTRFYLPKRTYTIVRLDGKAFHTFTSHLIDDLPYNEDLINIFSQSVLDMIPFMQNVCFAYHQSDEVSILMTDFQNIETSAWFDNNVQKIASVSSSILTATFFQELLKYPNFKNRGHALFDARVFTIPTPWEVSNYFLWRQKDCFRNAVQSCGQFYFGHKKIHGLSIYDVIKKLKEELNIDFYTYFNLRFVYGTMFIPSRSNENSSFISVPAINFKEDRNLFHSRIPINDLSDWQI